MNPALLLALAPILCILWLLAVVDKEPGHALVFAVSIVVFAAAWGLVVA